VTFFLYAEEGYGNNRSVMPSDVQSCTRTTVIVTLGVVVSSINVLSGLGVGCWPLVMCFDY